MENDINYSNKILLDFHNHFFDYYNQRQRIFVYILAAVVIIFSGYGLVLEKTLNATTIHPYNPQLLPIATVFSCLVMTSLNSILIHQGWSIRKTQWVVNRIREHFILSNDKNKIFGHYGSPKIALPDFYFICIISFEILKITISITTIFFCDKSTNNWSIASVIISMLTIITDAYIYQHLKPKE